VALSCTCKTHTKDRRVFPSHPEPKWVKGLGVIGFPQHRVELNMIK
jgi:hypothetical protein